jgi:hypothetical protein
MIKHFLLFAGLLLSMQVIAQTGIGTATPNASAKLDVSSSTMGFLPPRVTLTAANTFSPIVGTPSAAIGLLVYNLGSEGLKAGYYYWNGSNWATIATASSPDQTLDYVSVQSSGQTVVTGSKIMYNTTLSGNIPYNSSTGNFTLIAGKTYRLTAYATLDVSSSAGAELNFVWRNAANAELGNYALLLAANATITAAGQGIVDVIYTPTTNTTVSVYVNWAGGTVALRGGYTYATIQQIGSSATINPWILSGTTTYNTTGNVGIGTSTPTSRLNIVGGGIKIFNGFTNNSTLRPGINKTIIGNYEIRGVGGAGSDTQADGGDDGFLRLSAGGGSASDAQSFIDLSGFSTQSDMNRNIVFGTSSLERMRIDPSGNVNITGKLNIGDPTGNVPTKLVGRVTAGTFLTFDNLRFSVTTSGARGLSLATVSGSVNLYVEGRYNNGSVVGTRTDVPVNYTITPSGSPFGWDFARAGDTITYHFTDPDNSRMYRVTLIIMPSYINNFISIERLL